MISPFYFVTNPLSLAADQEALIADIKRQIGEDIPAVVCIDTLNRSISGSENSDEDMAAYIKAADAVRDAFNCLVVIVHHSGHEAQRPRGHSSLMGALDVQIAVSRDAENNVVAELELAKKRRDRELVLISRLESVEIGRDKDGDPIASCVIREVKGAAARIAAKKPGKSQRSDDVAKGQARHRREFTSGWLTAWFGEGSIAPARRSRRSRSASCVTRSSRGLPRNGRR